MITTIVKLLFLLANVRITVGRLWPYGRHSGDKWMDKQTVGSHVEPKSVVFDLPERVTMFDETDIQKLKIFENGLVSRDLRFKATLCPQSITKGYFLAAFWVPTDIRKSGRVYYRQETRYNSKSGLDYEALVEEVARGAEVLGSKDFYTNRRNGRSRLTVNDVKSLVVITWEKMVQPSSYFANPTHTNTFQMILVVTKRGTYKHLVAEKIDYFHFVSQDLFCRRSGVTAITDKGYHFDMTSFFYLDSSNIQFHSNVKNYEDLGRYVMILRTETPQPAPPRMNCGTKNADQFCRTGLRMDFCKHRHTGRYKHPSFCSKFVLCNGKTADVQECGSSLVYNPWIQNCDWPHSYRCQDTDFPNMMKVFHTQMRIGHFDPLVKFQYDPINLRFSTHSNNCVGIPQWGNTVDISSCDNYLMCTNTRTFLFRCPPSHDGQELYFNREKNFCDYRKNVNCTDGKRPGDDESDGDRQPVIITPPPIVTRSTVKTPKVTLPPGVNPCKDIQSGNVRDLYYCDHYYACQLGKILRRFSCPTSWNGETLFYDSEKDQCVYRNQVECVPVPLTTPTTTTTTTTTKMKMMPISD